MSGQPENLTEKPGRNPLFTALGASYILAEVTEQRCRPGCSEFNASSDRTCALMGGTARQKESCLEYREIH
jgi:hypothetical protein